MNVKLDFRIMTRLFGSICLVMFLGAVPLQATDATWINNGTIVLAPNIDATNVINNGSMTISTYPLPFDTSNTQNFTNSGSMNGSVGFRFDNAPRNSSGALIGQRNLARYFVNRNGGSISASEVGNTITNVALGSYGYVLVHATNIINQGTLAIGVDGMMQLVGTNVNIARSTLGVNPIVPTGSFNARTNFTPSTGITDNYWVQAQTPDPFNIAGLAYDAIFSVPPDLVTNQGVATPVHPLDPDVNLQFGFNIAYANYYTNVGPIISNGIPIVVTNYGDYYTNFVAAYTNVVGGLNITLTNLTGPTNFFLPTNLVRQAVFVKVASTNIGVDIRFSLSPQPTNFFRGVGVQLTTAQTNIFSQTNDYLSLYFSDTLASGTPGNTTNRGTLLNTRDGTRRPANYILSRAVVNEYSAGTSGNAVFTNTLLYTPDLVSRTSDGPYAGYSAFIDNLASRPPAIPAGDYTNNPGRIEIRAANLDMNRARIRTEGLLSIKAQHLINSSNAVIDSENIALNLGSTNGNLQVQSLMNDSVDRVTGTVNAFSFVWTNASTLLLTNYDNTSNPPVATVISNTIYYNYHVLMLDANVLQRQLPVTVHEFQAKATNVVINDNATLSRTFLVESDALTLNGDVTFSGSILNWNQQLVPTLKHFTNNGNLYISSEAHFGDEGNTSYASFVNSGAIQSFGQNIRSDYVQISGLNFASASINLQAGNALIDGGWISAGNAVTLAGGSIRLTNQATISSSEWLEINVANSLSDDGGNGLFFNEIIVRDGFYMYAKPAAGDLLGTAVFSYAPNYAQVNHVWAGRNDGANPAGFANNVALGALSLSPEGFDPLFVFSGAGADNGLYVDLLDISQLSDYASQLQIDPNLTLYYAGAILNPLVTLPGGQSPEEFLDGQFDGRLRWVKGFAGPNTTTTVTINGGEVIQVNTALVNSETIDSDADGIKNANDTKPFDGVNILSINRSTAPAGYQLTWNAAPSTLYRVEVSTNLISPVWSLQFTTTSTNAVTAPWTVLDTNATPAGVNRYYRVTYSPNN